MNNGALRAVKKLYIRLCAARDILRLGSDSTLLQYEKVLNLSCPSYEHVGLLKDWMNCEQPVVDSTKNYLEHRDQAGDLESPWYRAEEDTVDFVSLDPVADSWLSRLLTRTSLRYLFLV
jgi:hypothetical protein